METDHKPLVSIMVKPLNKAPNRLQRMLLKLQRYNLYVKYKVGKQTFVADTLSRAHLLTANTCEFVHSLEEINHTISLSLNADQLQQVKHVSTDDPVLQQLRETIRSGWPQSKSDVPECLHAYYDFRDELIAQSLALRKHPSIPM